MSGVRRWGLGLLLVGVLLASVAGWGWRTLSNSLPQLDGQASLSGLTAAVSITRDALGVPDVRARTREDLARAVNNVLL